MYLEIFVLMVYSMGQKGASFISEALGQSTAIRGDPETPGGMRRGSRTSTVKESPSALNGRAC